MSVTNFIPEVWAKAILANLNRAHVFADRMNNDYEGDLSAFGDTVRINSIGRVTAFNYTRNAGLGGTAASPTITGIPRPEITQGSSMSLVVDQAKGFNVAVDDWDKRVTQPKFMSDLMREAAYSISDAIDLYCGSALQTGVAGTGDGTGNRLNARTLGTGAGDDDAYETLVDLKVKLREADVPTSEQMWVVVPPWFTGLLQKDVRFTNYGTGPNRDTLLNGIIGRAAGLDIYESNNLSGTTSGTLASAGGAYTIIAGIKKAATFAQQIESNEAFRPPDGFNDAYKGLSIYGAKVTRPYALASVAVTQS